MVCIAEIKASYCVPKSRDRWHYEHNKLVSYPPPGKKSTHLDIAALFDTNKSPRGKEKVKSNWKLASGRQLRPIWHWSPDWLTYTWFGLQSKQSVLDVANLTPTVYGGRFTGKMMPNEAVRLQYMAVYSEPWLQCEWVRSCSNELLWFLLLFLLIEFSIALCLVGFTIFIYHPVCMSGMRTLLTCNISFEPFAFNFVKFCKNIHTAQRSMAFCFIYIQMLYCTK